MDYQRPIYISGKVVLEDGTPVPNGVRVELLYNGQAKRQEYTRSDGSFTFDLTSPGRATISDASLSGSDNDIFGGPLGGGRLGGGVDRSMGRIDLTGFEVRASIPGYASETVMLQSRSALDNPDIGVIVMRPLSRVKATTISLNSLKAPKDARKSFESAQKSLAKKKPDYDKALKELNKAVSAYPSYAAAWQLMGEVRRATNDLPGARQAFEKALEADSQFINPYLSLASLEIESNRWPEAARITGELLDLNPYVVRGHFLHAVATFNLGNMNAAAESARTIQKSDEAKDYPLSHYILGFTLAQQGDLKAAADELRTYVRLQPDSQYTERVKNVLQEWQQKGLIAAEQSPANARPAPK
ncbi:MAG TPA: tetratricopeptide repeat protein [Acidobacteriota bacterium]|nr:tetratricopeptide repeat protein [Acidobacteriota bacterium]